MRLEPADFLASRVFSADVDGGERPEAPKADERAARSDH
jgi:hypothetical protein